MRRASLFLGVLAAAALAGALAAPTAWAQSAVTPGGAVGGGGASASSGYIVPVGAVGGAAAISTSTGYRLFGGPAAAVPIGPILSQTASTPPNAGADAPIRVQVTNGVNAALWVYYRLGGEGASAYRQVAMTSGDNVNYTATLPAAHVGPRGVEYYVYGVQAGGVTTLPYRDARQNPIQQPFQMATYPALSPPDAQYRLVGFSFAVDPAMVHLIFNDDLGDTSNTQWKLGRWNDALGVYQSYYDVNPVRRGRGYWLIRRGGAAVDAAGLSAFQDTSVGSTKYAKIVLQPGWNQIANPFAFAVSWDSRLVDGAVDNHLWSWGGEVYDSTGSLLHPFTGYWVDNKTSGPVMLLLPYSEAVLSKSSPRVVKMVSDGWRLGLAITAGDLADRATEIGAATEATDGIDALDYGKPPCPPGRFVALGVLASADGSRPKRLAGDFRAPSAAGWRFPLLVQGVEAGAATLRLAGAERLPAACKVALVDPRTGTAYDLSGDGAIVLPHLPTPEGVRYDLVVGPEAWVDGEVGPTTTMPRRHALEACHPNPFNPLTRIAFELPAPARARIEVLDVAGRRVAVLLDEQLAGGRHVVEWNGRDARGRGVASGTYYYRLSADDFTRTRSMTLLK